MSKIIYNEGRVVGYSAYEVYVKQSLSIDPDTPPASEREWLASSLSMGSSMLLKVSADNISGPHKIDIPFPTNTKLVAANTIIGNWFNGEGHTTSNSPWCDRVTSYGNLLSNISNNCPPTGVNNNPSDLTMNGPASDLSQEDKNKLKNYIKIIDGIIIQPGNWVEQDNSIKPPEKGFKPDLSKKPVLRLLVSDKISTTFYLLLTGFTLNAVVAGETGLDLANETVSPENGDFLGPALFPWSNKVVFSQPGILLHYLSDFIGSGSQNVIIEHDTNPDNPPTKITVKNDIDRGSKTEITSSPKKSSNSNRLPDGYAGQNVYVGQSAEVGPDVTKIGVKNIITPVNDTGKQNSTNKQYNNFIDVRQQEDGGKTDIHYDITNLIAAGNAIDITYDKDTGKATITNLFPNYTSDANYITITPGNHYTLRLFNGWYTIAGQVINNTRNPNNLRSGHLDNLRVRISPAINSNTGELISCAFDITSRNTQNYTSISDSYSSNYAKLNNKNLEHRLKNEDLIHNLNLNHAATWYTPKESDGWTVDSIKMNYTNGLIGVLRFKNNITISGKSINLNSLFKNAASDDNTYKFLSTTTGGSGVLNNFILKGFKPSTDEKFSNADYERRSYCGASWNIYMSPLIVTDGIISEARKANSKFYNDYLSGSSPLVESGDVLIIASRIADGWNRQFYEFPYYRQSTSTIMPDGHVTGNYSDGETLGCGDGNFQVFGLLYK